jgi:hypothetical protein
LIFSSYIERKRKSQGYSLRIGEVTLGYPRRKKREELKKPKPQKKKERERMRKNKKLARIERQKY